MPSILIKLLLLAQLMLPPMRHSAQAKEGHLQVEVCYEKKHIEAGKSFLTSGGDTITITSLKFYLCDTHLPAGQNAHLIDLEESSSLFIAARTKDGKVELLLGIDSLTHHLGPLPGDLDPVHGMYWTWQTGYIFLKVEGFHSRCSGKNHFFEFHLGGFSGNDKAYLPLNLLGSQDASTLKLDLQAFLDETDWTDYNPVMSPGPEAVRIMKKLASSFTLK